MTAASLLGEKLGLSQQLSQAAGGGEGSHCPGLHGLVGRSRRCSGQTGGACYLGTWVARRAVSPENNDNFDNQFMCCVWSTDSGDKRHFVIPTIPPQLSPPAR